MKIKNYFVFAYFYFTVATNIERKTKSLVLYHIATNELRKKMT